jgi:hypothetical protein
MEWLLEHADDVDIDVPLTEEQVKPFMPLPVLFSDAGSGVWFLACGDETLRRLPCP